MIDFYYQFRSIKAEHRTKFRLFCLLFHVFLFCYKTWFNYNYISFFIDYFKVTFNLL